MFRSLKQIDWRIFAILLGAGMVGVAAVLPYVIEMVGSLPIGPAPISLSLVVVLALVQNGILLAVAIAIGLILSQRIGLQLPLIRAWARGEPRPSAGPILLPGLLAGALVGAILVGVEVIFFLRHLPVSLHTQFEIPLWKRLLAGVLYGGITEELLMRLFLLSMVAWLLGRWWKATDVRPARGAFRAAIIFTAVLFGLGHLPATAAIGGSLTPALVGRALVLNGVAGIAYGYLYWRRGLEAAMAAHAGTHLVLQIPGVMLIRTLL